MLNASLHGQAGGERSLGRRIIDPEREAYVFEHALERLRAFEARLDPVRPFADGSPAHPMHGGGLTPAFGIEGLPGLTFRRLPPFASATARSYYERAVESYRHLLDDRLGLPVVAQRCLPLTSRTGASILYIAQVRQPSDRLGPAVLGRATEQEAEALLEALLAEVARVWHRNAIDAPSSITGLDARLANWSLTLRDGAVESLLYLGATLPFFRRVGREMTDPTVFMDRLVPPFPALVAKGFQERLDRYYDLRLVLMDLAADLYREGLEAYLPLALDVINRFAESSAEDLYVEPISRAEVDRHYRQDARFWARFHTFSRISRFAQVYLYRRPYEHLLPDKR